MKRIFLLCLSALFALTTWAYDFSDDSTGTTIFYTILDDSTVETTFENDDYNSYSGSVVVPETVIYEGNTYSVVDIGQYTFADCSELVELKLPKTITCLNHYSLRYCSNLTTMISLNPTPPELTGRAFNNFDPSNCVLYVPKESIDEYSWAHNWGQFLRIEEYVEVAFPTVVTGEATNVTQTTATLHGSVTGGTLKIIEQGFEYTTGDGVILTVTAEGEEMTSTVENLSKATSYDYRAYAKLEDDIVYGEDNIVYGDVMSFSTMADYDFVYNGLYFLIKDNSTKTCIVTYLYPSSFNGNVYSGDIVIPSSCEIDGNTYTVVGINDYAFYYCLDLTSITIPETVTSIGGYAFAYCGLTELTIPDNVTSIGTYAFRNNTSLLKATIGDGMKTIPEGIFLNCTKMEVVTVPKDITSLGRECFSHCASLKEFTIPETVTSIGNMAFEGCTTLTSMVVPDGVTSLNYTFYDCTALEEVTLGKYTVTLGSSVFNKCSSLKEISLPETLTSIGSFCFYQCSSLTELTIPDAVTSLPYESFAYCSNLREVSFGSGLKEIEGDAFYGCEALTSVDIPNTVESLGSYAFAYCSSLNDVTLPSSLKEIDDYTFTHCEALSSVTIPNTVESLGNGAFYGCTNLVKIKIPNSVNSLDYSVFQNCTSLAEVTLGKSVESFGQAVFENCSSLAKFYSLNPEPASAPYANVFNNIYDRCILYVPLGTSMVYSTARAWWGFFYDIIELADVETLEATDVTETTATLNGTIEVGELCETTTSKGFEIWEEANPNNVIIRLVSGDSLTCVIDGLSLETTYVYHAFVTTATSSSYGDDVEFTTSKVFINPTVLTYDATDITSTSALIKGYVEAGTEEITEQGFEYWTGEEEPESITSDDNVMALILSGLFPYTTYTYHAFAVTASGTTYGENVSFTTGEDTSTGIDNVGMGGINGENVEGIYSTSGQKLNTTVKGVNIIRYTDGTTKKVLVK